MVDRRKVIKVIVAVLLFAFFNLLIVLTGCSDDYTGGKVEAGAGQGQDIDIDEKEVPEGEGDEPDTAEESLQETDAAPDEYDSQEEGMEDSDKNTGSGKQSSTYSDKKGNTIKDIYQRFIDSGKPSIIVFSYDEDCCPGTKAFFEEYNDSAMKLLRSYAGSFNALYINVGDLSDNNMNTVIEIASSNGVLNLPSILILDGTGNAYKVIEGPFDETVVKNMLEGMIDDQS